MPYQCHTASTRIMIKKLTVKKNVHGGFFLCVWWSIKDMNKVLVSGSRFFRDETDQLVNKMY